jgi:hypothetical protein
MTNYLSDEPAKYRIRVEGRLDSQWAARWSDLTLAVREGEGPTAVMDLTGWIADQAALMGVLAQLYSLGVTVLSVERVNEDAGSPGTQS